MDVIELISSESAKAINDVRGMLEAHSIEKITIKTDEDAKGALEAVVALKSAKKELKASKDEEVAPHYTKYTEIRDHFNDLIDKIDMVTKAFDNAYKVYDAEKERIRIEAQRKIDEKMAAERRKAEEAAEKARLKAEELAAAGRPDLAEKYDRKAEEKAAIAVETPTPVVQKNVVKNVRGGFNTQKKYRAQILNMKNAIRHFHINGIPPEIVEATQKVFNRLAKADKGASKGINGVVKYYVL